jgi:hypothetical protein
VLSVGLQVHWSLVFVSRACSAGDSEKAVGQARHTVHAVNSPKLGDIDLTRTHTFVLSL